MMLVLRNMLLILARKNERMFAALDGLSESQGYSRVPNNRRGWNDREGWTL